jgi:hypothetical protein
MVRILLDIISIWCYNIDIVFLKEMVMGNLTIDGLTHKQVAMLDEMWSLDTEYEFLDWYENLSEKDQHECDMLQRLILIEAFDAAMVQTNDFTEANEALSKFRIQK